ncbi:MAG: hypothetical protein IH588_19760 [Anaerolineales bacterium]|nr:hypothetical protein [Anaerolineales bacterium]
MKSVLLVTTSGILAAIFLFSPRLSVHAQDGCGFNADGSVIPCPPTEERQEDQKNTPVFIPPTSTFTSTPTNTPTSTPSPTSSPTPTSTEIPDTATPTITPTLTSTPTPTPIPVAQSALPGAGIGALILFLIVGFLLPAIQKIRTARRGY